MIESVEKAHICLCKALSFISDEFLLKLVWIKEGNYYFDGLNEVCAARLARIYWVQPKENIIKLCALILMLLSFNEKFIQIKSLKFCSFEKFVRSLLRWVLCMKSDVLISPSLMTMIQSNFHTSDKRFPKPWHLN